MKNLRHISNGKIVTPNSRIETNRGIAGTFRGMRDGNVLIAFPPEFEGGEPVIEEMPPKKLNLVVCP